MKILNAPAVILAFLIAGSGTGCAPDLDRGCYDANPDIRLEKCSAAIEAGHPTTTQLSDFYATRGSTYLGKNLIDQALSDYAKAIELNSGNAAAYLDRGIVYTRKGLFEQAIADESKAAELWPDNPSAYYNRGRVYGLEGLYDQAVADFTKAIALNHQDYNYFLERSVAYEGKGLSDLAAADHDMAQVLMKPWDKRLQRLLRLSHPSQGVDNLAP